MAIRTKKYKTKQDGRIVKAIKITEKNLTDIVAYIVKKGGAATGHLGDTASRRPARIRIKQRNYGENWGKFDWRVARLGDYIIIDEFQDYKVTEFARVKVEHFDDIFDLVK